MYKRARQVKRTGRRIPGFKPSKGMGQNFLTDRQAAVKMVEIISPEPDEMILEIGPGQGALTRVLLDAGARVHGVEYDERLFRFLGQEFEGSGKFTAACQDILTFDLGDFTRETGQAGIRVVGNLPYLISHRILQWLVSGAKCIPEAFITLQKEVAQRLLARPNTKEYGPVTITTACFYTTHKQMSLPAGYFSPRPKVGSTFLKLARQDKETGQITDTILLFDLVRQSFRQRRKMLNNNLTGWQVAGSTLDAQAVRGLEEKSGISFSRRAESLTRQEFITLSNVLHEYQHASK